MTFRTLKSGAVGQKHNSATPIPGSAFNFVSSQMLNLPSSRKSNAVDAKADAWPRCDAELAAVQGELQFPVGQNHADTLSGNVTRFDSGTQTRFAPESASSGNWISAVFVSAWLPTNPTHR